MYMCSVCVCVFAHVCACEQAEVSVFTRYPQGLLALLFAMPLDDQLASPNIENDYGITPLDVDLAFDEV